MCEKEGWSPPCTLDSSGHWLKAFTRCTFRELITLPVHLSNHSCDAHICGLEHVFLAREILSLVLGFLKARDCLSWPLIYCISPYAKHGSLPVMFLEAFSLLSARIFSFFPVFAHCALQVCFSWVNQPATGGLSYGQQRKLGCCVSCGLAELQ